MRACQLLRSRYIPTTLLAITRVAEQQQSKCHPKQPTQLANEDDDTQNSDEAGAAKNGCCCCRCSGGSALAESERASNGKRENGYVSIGSKGRNNNTCCLSLQHGVVTLPGRFIIIAFVSCTYKYVVLSAGTKEVPRALCLISHITRRFQAS